MRFNFTDTLEILDSGMALIIPSPGNSPERVRDKWFPSVDSTIYQYDYNIGGISVSPRAFVVPVDIAQQAHYAQTEHFGQSGCDFRYYVR